MDRYEDYASHYPDASSSTGDTHSAAHAHFEHWYRGFKRKLRDERNPSLVDANDPRFSSGPWGIQSAVSVPSPLSTNGRSVPTSLPLSNAVMRPTRPPSVAAKATAFTAVPIQQELPPLASIAASGVMPPPLAPEAVVPLGAVQLPYSQTLPAASRGNAIMAMPNQMRPLPIYGVTNVNGGSQHRGRTPSNAVPPSARQPRQPLVSAPSRHPAEFPMTTALNSALIPRAQGRGMVANTPTLQEILARRDGLQQQEHAVRRGIIDAELKHRAFIVNSTPAFVGDHASARRAAHQRDLHGVAVQILRAHQDALRLLMEEECARRLPIAEGFDAWLGVIATKESSERQSILSRQGLICAKWLSTRTSIATEDEERAQREAIIKAEGASYQLLTVRAEALRSAYQALWRGMLGQDSLPTVTNTNSVRQRHPSSLGMPPAARADPASLSGILSRVARHRLQQLLTQHTASEERERAALTHAEEGHRETMVVAFAARTSVRVERQRALIIAVRAAMARSWAAIAAEEEAGRRAVENAADGWLREMALQHDAVLVQHKAALERRSAMVLRALNSLPKLSDLEEDEAARRRYLQRVYWDWCEQTLAPVGRQLMARYHALGAATLSLRGAIYEGFSALMDAEASARGAILDGEAQWWPLLLAREGFERAEGVPQLMRDNAVARHFSPAFQYAQANYAAMALIVEAETSRREAILAAEAQWYRFAKQSMHPMGRPPSVAAVAVMRTRDEEAGRGAGVVSNAFSGSNTIARQTSRGSSQRSPTVTKAPAAVTDVPGKRARVPWEEATDPIRSAVATTMSDPLSAQCAPSPLYPSSFPLTHRSFSDNAVNMQYFSTDVDFVPVASATKGSTNAGTSVLKNSHTSVPVTARGNRINASITPL